MVSRGGIEPPTRGFSFLYSTKIELKHSISYVLKIKIRFFEIEKHRKSFDESFLVVKKSDTNLIKI